METSKHDIINLCKVRKNQTEKGGDGGSKMPFKADLIFQL